MKPRIAYLAYSFTGGPHGAGTPSDNLERARRMAKLIMIEFPDIFVIVPHYAVDAMLDGTITWEEKHEFDEYRRMQGGLMSLALLSRVDMLILGCQPEYKYSHGVTWEWIFAQLLNRSYRKDNPIEIKYVEDMIGEKRYKAIMELREWK